LKNSIIYTHTHKRKIARKKETEKNTKVDSRFVSKKQGEKKKCKGQRHTKKKKKGEGDFVSQKRRKEVIV